MDAQFWHNKWSEGLIGFHQADVNQFLQSHWAEMGLNGRGEVLVPLCGKSLDMMWLVDQGHSVLGVELSSQALDDFLDEQNLSTKATPLSHTHYCGYQLPDMTLFCGDFFHLTAADCESITAVYDRAALVALPKHMRADYVRHLIAILPQAVSIFLVTMTYDAHKGEQGPPFSVPDEEVFSLFESNYTCEPLLQKDALRKNKTIREVVWRLTPSLR